jgi:hypothetical protein
VIVTLPLPRYVIAKPLASGKVAFYFNIPTRYRQLGCSLPNEPLGTDYAVACGVDGNGGRAAALNALFDEWMTAKNGEPLPSIARYGTVDWLFREYMASKRYRERVSARTRPDYERTMLLVADLVTKKGDRVGNRPVKSITPLAADKIYERVCDGPRGPRPRQGEKVIAMCRAAWRVVHRLHPDCFDRDVPNPWDGVTKQRRVMATKKAATREQVYAFAAAAVAAGHPEAAGAAVICFEWLQRPENVLAGYVRWTDYRGREAPTAIRITHHKTGAAVLHPLEDEAVQFYADAEAVLAQVPRRGVPMILKPKKLEPYTAMQMAKIVRKVREIASLPEWFTLDACRHGGMTELEEAELTDGQGRALSGHRSKAYDGYAKRTFKRALAATRKRHAHTLVNAQGTSVQNDAQNRVQNGEQKEQNGIA